MLSPQHACQDSAADRLRQSNRQPSLLSRVAQTHSASVDRSREDRQLRLQPPTSLDGRQQGLKLRRLSLLLN